MSDDRPCQCEHLPRGFPAPGFRCAVCLDRIMEAKNQTVRENNALRARVRELEAAASDLLADVARYLERGGTLTDREAGHVARLHAALEDRP